jgi:hypothetical protein
MDDFNDKSITMELVASQLVRCHEVHGPCSLLHLVSGCSKLSPLQI